MSSHETNHDSLAAVLGQVVADRRRAAGLSQEELANKAGLHRTYVSEIERRARNLSVKILARLAFALDTSPSDLMAEAENRQERSNETTK